MQELPNDTLNEKINQALEDLKANYTYYAEAKGVEFFERIKNGQHPKATLIGCSDARFRVKSTDLNIEDDIFVVRNIGNQFMVAAGSVEYGVHHLHTPLLLVMGHTRCGAIKAAISEYRHERVAIRREIDHLAIPIRNYVGTLELEPKIWLKAVMDNVNFQVEECVQCFENEVASGKLTIIGLVYDIANDMGNGYGKITPINLNGENNEQKLKESPLLKAFFS